MHKNKKMEAIFDCPILIEYLIDPIDNTLYNNITHISSTTLSTFTSSFSSSFIYSNYYKITSFISSSPSTSSPSSSSLLNLNQRYWTKFSFKFYFSIFDESKYNKFESLLLDSNYFHSHLSPIIVYKKDIQEINNYSSFSFFLNQKMNENILIASSKENERNDNREVILKYDLYLAGIVRPLSNFFDLNTLERFSNSSLPSSSIDQTILDHLISIKLSNFDSFLLLLSMISIELNEIHSQGLCHYHLDLNSFLLYTPSNQINDNDNDNNENNNQPLQWGVQIMSHWLFFPSGPYDATATNTNTSSTSSSLKKCHSENSKPCNQIKFINIQTDIFYLGCIYLEMTLCWIMKSLLPHKSELSSYIIQLLSYSQFKLILADCISTNQCNEQFIDLLSMTLSLLYPIQSKQIMEQFISLCNYLIHVDSFERYDCFYIEKVLQDIIDSF